MEQLSWIAIVLWAAGLVMNSALLILLTWRRWYRLVPAFTGWVSWAVLSTIGLYVGRRFGDQHFYAALYWGAAFIELLLEVLVFAELVNIVFRRGGRWIGTSRPRLVAGGVLVVLFATYLAVIVAPAASSAKDAVYSRISLFETVLFTGLFAVALAVSQQLRISWEDLVVREGSGFILLNLVSFITDTLHAYWRTAEHFGDLENLRMTVYLLTLAYWIVVFWRPKRLNAMVGSETKKQFRDFRHQLESGRMRRDKS